MNTKFLGEALRIMKEEPERFTRLRANAKSFHLGLKKVFENTNFKVCGDELSPMQHVIYEHTDSTVVDRKLDELVDEV